MSQCFDGVNILIKGLELRITVILTKSYQPLPSRSAVSGPPGPLTSRRMWHVKVKQGRPGCDVSWHNPPNHSVL